VAGGDKEHKMLFDLRGGHRRNLVKVVYAVLAILMGASLFLTVGPFSIAEIFGGGGGSSNLAKPYEEEAERIEARLAKDPANPQLLISLTRAELNAGNADAQKEPSGEVVLTTDSVQFYQQADQTWSEYLKATDKPDPALAALVAPMQIQLAETSTSFQQADQHIRAAKDAQEIAAKARPTASALVTLSFYSYFTGDTAAAEKARSEAKKLASSDSQRKEIDKLLDQYKKNASSYVARKTKAEKEQKAAGGGAPETLENPLSPGVGLGG
jgi:hypothetical protein